MTEIHIKLLAIYLTLVLTTFILGGVAGQAIDEILEQAGKADAGLQRSFVAQTLASRIGIGNRLSSDGTLVITELDIANSLPIEGEEVVVTERSARGGGGSKAGNNVITLGGSGSRGRNGGSRGGSRTNQGGNRRTPAQRRGNNSRRRGKRNALKDRGRYWNSKVIPYVISGSFSSFELGIIQQAIVEYNLYTCIQFVRRRNENDYIDIVREGGCWSFVGKLGGRQRMSLGTNCANVKKTPIHEMLHALGVYHQHTRTDRDSFVRIHEENIPSNRLHNFNKRTSSEVTVYNTPYSYLSVMHYSRTAFTSNGRDTITTIDASFLNKIGRGSTFSYEDLKLLHEMYQCNSRCSPISCPPNSYQGSDCTCHCKNTANPDVPVIKNCGNGDCMEPHESCSCSSRANACSRIPNSSCNSRTNECQCNSGFSLYNGACISDRQLPCERLGEDCKCSLNNNKCPSSIANSLCSTSSNSCFCPSGFSASSDRTSCVRVESCNVADKSCSCSQKGAGACNGVPNSSCDSATDSCKCNEDFYNSNGVCRAAPACTTLNQSCRCSVQGADACNAIPNAACDTSTDRCVCNPATHKEERGTCVRANKLLSDGSRLQPFFTSRISTTSFTPTRGSDSNSFGIAFNGWYLFASGTRSGDQAAFETEWLTVAGRYCVDYSVRLNNAKIYTEYTYDGTRYGYRSLYNIGEMNYFLDTSHNRNTNTKIKFRIRAEPVYNRGWSASVDPISVYLCNR